jgi:hypothetical protein
MGSFARSAHARNAEQAIRIGPRDNIVDASINNVRPIRALGATICRIANHSFLRESCILYYAVCLCKLQLLAAIPEIALEYSGHAGPDDRR